MAFESVKVQLQIGGGAAVATWRQDATVGSIITCSLSDTTGMTAFHWWLMGRPEGSGAGGGGPEPLDLGTAATATFTIDLRGTYIVWCQVNSGQPNAATIRGGVAFLESIVDPDGRPLRQIGGMETDEDTADALVRQGWIKILNRWLKKLAAGGGGVDDHLVKARNLDTSTVGGLREKVADSASVIGNVVTEAGVEKLQLTALGSDPVTANAQKSYLYTAKVASVNLDKGQCACRYLGYFMCGWSLFDGWTEGPTGTFTKNVPGPLVPSDLDGVDPDAFNTSGVSSMIGKRILASPATLGTDLENCGPYIIDDVGGHYENYGLPGQVFVQTHAVFRRDPDFNESSEFVTGMSFQMQTGNVYGTKYLQLTTAGPIVLGTTEQDWATFDENPNPLVAASYPLLTAAQLYQASTETAEAEAVINSASGLTTLLVASVSPDFRTLVGTPGLATIPAGQFVADMLAKVSTAATGDTTLNVRILKDDGMSFTELFNFTTSAVTTTSYVNKQLSQAITLQNIAGCRLVFHLRAQTTSATFVTVSVIVNDASHSCRLTFPVEFAGGIGEHNSLPGLQGGTAPDEFYHLTAAEYALLGGDGIRVLDADWYNATEVGYVAVPGLRFADVPPGVYLYKAEVRVQVGGTYYLGVGGSAAVANCSLLHRTNDWIVNVTTPLPAAATKYDESLVETWLGEVFGIHLVCVGPIGERQTVSGTMVHRIEGIIVVTATGNIDVIANTGTTGYGLSYILAYSHAELTLTSMPVPPE